MEEIDWHGKNKISRKQKAALVASAMAFLVTYTIWCRTGKPPVDTVHKFLEDETVAIESNDLVNLSERGDLKPKDRITLLDVYGQSTTVVYDGNSFVENRYEGEMIRTPQDLMNGRYVADVKREVLNPNYRPNQRR